ncbi:MAG: DUF192 domain-containing protein [Elusimicrobia bacterium]|nr:DUF192 domain-containing protein [Elusimicrobiota bacterium]
MKFYNLTKNNIAVENVIIIKEYFEKIKGLLGRNKIEDNEGFLIKECNCIHTLFMRFSVDLVFLKMQIMPQKRDPAKAVAQMNPPAGGTDYTDRITYRVVKIMNNIKPWRICMPVFDANAVLEIKAGITAKNMILTNDELEIV